MVIVLLANGFEELEAITPVDVLRRHNVDVRTVSITSDRLVTGTHGIQVAADLLASDVPLTDIDMLVLPGGMPGVKNLDASTVTKNFIEATLKNGGHLAAICAAPSIFGKHGMLTNIKATCFPGFEGEMLNAILEDTDVITDGVFTTARDYKAASAFADELVKICDILGILPHDESEVETVSDEVIELENDPPEKLEDISELLDSLLTEFEKEEEELSSVLDDAFDEVVSETKADHAKISSIPLNYQLPSLDLLHAADCEISDTAEIARNANTIIETLASFNVEASIKGIDRGPRFIRYAITPAKGVKVNSILRLYDDVALCLGKEGVRMQAPIPGTTSIGLEVPCDVPKTVFLREILECDEYANSSCKTLAAIGKDIAGSPIVYDLTKLPHLIVGGATGMGKSVCINSILASILYKARPDEVNFILIDPKKVEFRPYENLPHLITPVITECKAAAGALAWAIDEMEHRYSLIEKANVRNVDAYNDKLQSGAIEGKYLPKIFIVIDELADLMMQVRDPIEDLIMRIAQKARAAGIHLIIGTQRPSVQVITGVIKANIPSRISFKVASQVDSRTIFDMAGAEKLLNRGDALFLPVSLNQPIRVQCPFISDREVEEIVEHVKGECPDACYNEEVAEYISDYVAKLNEEASRRRSRRRRKDEDEDAPFPFSFSDTTEDENAFDLLGDETFLNAVELSLRARKVSTSLLQRKLSIGYGKAAKYIDAMQEFGIVSEPNGQKPREVLITLEEWEEWEDGEYRSNASPSIDNDDDDDRNCCDFVPDDL